MTFEFTLFMIFSLYPLVFLLGEKDGITRLNDIYLLKVFFLQNILFLVFYGQLLFLPFNLFCPQYVGK